MKKLLLTSLCSITFLIAVSLPVEARIVIGLTPASPITKAEQFAKELAKVAGEEVQLRKFDNEAAVTNWLLRFQELDAAVVMRGYIEQQPAGTLRHLADLHKVGTKTPLAVVVRSNLTNTRIELVKSAFIKLGTTTGGQNALAAANFDGVSLPGEAIARKASKPKPVQAPPVTKEPAATPKPVIKKPAIKTEALPEPKQKPAPAKKPEVSLEQKIPVPSPKATTPAKKPEPVAKQLPAPTAKPAEKQLAPESSVKQPEKTVLKPVAPTKKESVEAKPKTDKPDQKAQPPQTTSEEKPAPSNKRLILFIALVIIVIILLKIALLFMRWKNNKRKAIPPVRATFVDTTPEPEEVAPVAIQEQAPQADPLVVETGHLGPGKVPELLKRCADLPEPVVLQVVKGSCEKLIHFAGGQVSGAMTQNASAQESGVRWNKLGSMLLREEFITKEERDQALALLTREPSLRFGEALLKLGYINLAELRHALTRQAKITIYSLILFPEGKYKVFSEEGSLPPEESVALEVTKLIREASHHQSEWMAIREALPNLNTALNFTPEGRDKLEKVNISPQQQEMLALIDGKRTINELSVSSTLMDYEVYRFLYLMVKAGVLQ